MGGRAAEFPEEVEPDDIGVGREVLTDDPVEPDEPSDETEDTVEVAELAVIGGRFGGSTADPDVYDID